MWALSSREDKVALVIIFKALQEKCGNLQAAWFMSDMATQFLEPGRLYVMHNNLNIFGAYCMQIVCGKKD